MKTANVPIMETGMASTGINVARQLCKKKKYYEHYETQCFQKRFDNFFNGNLHH